MSCQPGVGSRAVDGAAVTCVALALALIAGTVLLGVPLHGRLAGHDADFAISALAHLLQEWGAAPGIPPAWLTDMHGGFGGPLFQFYPPLAFLLAAGMAWLLAVDPATALALSAGLARLAALGTSFLWLRGTVSARNAWIGAAAYTLLPFTALVDPVVRFAYSELVATAILPLLPLAIGWRQDGPRVPLIGAAVALIALTNVPVAVAGGVACGLYGLVLGGWRRLLETVLGGALGVALAAWHLVPALLGMAEINLAAMQDAGHHWTGALLFSGVAMRFDLFQAMLHACLAVLLGGACAFVVLQPRPFDAGYGRASFAACLGALALCTPLTRPAWQVFGLLLDWVQFPWRFLLPATLFSAALTAVLAERSPWLRTWIALAICAAGLATPVFVLGVNALAPGGAVLFLSGPARVEWAQAEVGDPLEYVPAAARAAGWLPWMQAGRLPPGVTPDPALAGGEVRGLRLQRLPGGLRVSGEALHPTPIVLPQFWYPGWRVLGVGDTGLEPSAMGLIQVSVTPGPFELLVIRGELPGSVQGLAISVTALAIALWRGLWDTLQRRRPTVRGSIPSESLPNPID